MTPRPNLSADPLDHAPPSSGPPSKPDYAAVQLALMRQTLGRPRPPRLPGDQHDGPTATLPADQAPLWADTPQPASRPAERPADLDDDPPF